MEILSLYTYVCLYITVKLRVILPKKQQKPTEQQLEILCKSK